MKPTVLPCLLVGALLIGCVEPATLSQDDQEVLSVNTLSVNRLSMNRLSMNRLSMNRLSMNRLSTYQLSTTQTSLNGLADTVEGRELLSYVVRCALPFGLALSVVDSAGTVQYTFWGQIGLAPEWESSALTTTSQRWVSACLLAHVNAFGVAVPISLRGSHAALATTTLERNLFPVKEGGFYGNVFADVNGDGQADIQAFACQGYSMSSEAYVDNRFLQDRVCALIGGVCAFSVVGCESADPGAAWVCDQKSSGTGPYFNRCYTAGRTSSGGFPGTAVKYAEIITSYLPAGDD